MTFLVPATASWAIGVIGVALASVLCWQEWRRADSRHLWLRLIATIGAVAALTMLGLRPARRQAPGAESDHPGEALVWTGGSVPASLESARPTLDRVPAEHRFTLPSGNVPPGEHANPIPDLAYLRRHFPDLTGIDLIGQGLLPAELDALRGCTVTFQPTENVPPVPAITFINYPNQLELGAPLWVQGSLKGARLDLLPHVSLLGPDGSVTEAAVRLDGTGKQLLFDVKGPALAAKGRFVWRLRVTATGAQGREPAGDAFGVSVVEPALPRLLVLEDSPHPDSASVRRWMERLGGKITIRTRVGAGRYRFTSAPGAPGEFTALDEPMLAAFDLVVVDAGALASLTAVERSSLEHSVAGGLGVLATGLAPNPPPAADGPPSNFFLSGKVVPLQPAGEASDTPNRLVRPQWAGQSRVSDIAIPAEPFEIQLPEGETGKLMVDGQGHVVTASARRGRGQIALSLLGDTWRWNLQSDEAAFADYWSFLFSTLARAQGATGVGRWSLRDGGEPVFVDEPVELTWTGKAPPATPAVVTYGGNFHSSAELALAQEPQGGPTWAATFWPREAGWHQVVLPGTGASLSFFVNGDGWRPLREASRQAATQRFAAFSQGPRQETRVSHKAPGEEVVPISPGWFFAVFLASAGLLWAERYDGLRPRLFSREP